MESFTARARKDAQDRPLQRAGEDAATRAASRILLVFSSLGFVLAPATGCGEGPAGPVAEPILIAATYSETGPREKSATEMMRGYRLAVDMLNETGGVGGREVRLLVRDDGSDAPAAARHYFEFVTTDSIDLVLSPYSSPITEAVMAVTEAAGWPLIAPLASAPELWSGRERRWSVQMLNPAPSYHQGALELAAEHGARTAALAYENTRFPAAMARGVREAAEARGLEIVMDRSFPLGGADHAALVSVARDANADLFAGGSYFPDALAFARALAGSEYAPMLVSLNLGPEDPQFADEVGVAARCMMGNTAWLPRMRTSGFIATSDAFVDRYEAAHGERPNRTAAAGFGAVELLAEAIAATLTADGGIDHAAVRDHLFAARPPRRCWAPSPSSPWGTSTPAPSAPSRACRCSGRTTGKAA